MCMHGSVCCIIQECNDKDAKKEYQQQVWCNGEFHYVMHSQKWVYEASDDTDGWRWLAGV